MVGGLVRKEDVSSFSPIVRYSQANAHKSLTIMGPRPEAIKLCPVILELQSRPHEFESIAYFSAQHREMLEQVLAVFEVQPDHDLNIMLPG